MFIDKSRYRGTTRVRIMDQRLENGKWKKKLVTHVGTARSDSDLKVLIEKAKETLNELRHKDQMMLDFADVDLSGLRTIGSYHQGADLVLGNLFDRFGIDLPRRDLLRKLVMARIINPVSKRRTIEFLNHNFGAHLEKDQVYRFLDRLSRSEGEILSSARSYLVKEYQASFGFVLYDVTTLYFESDNEDEDQGDNPGLRKKGYSKDKRDDLPQVVLGLGVNSLGMPLTYRLYPGNTYEGSTLIAGVDETLEILGKETLTVVGDAGMLSERNLSALEERNLTYIVGARLKSLPRSLQDQILNLDFTNSTTRETIYKNRRLIISYSAQRARRAASQRKRSIARLEVLIAKNQAIRKHQYLDFTIKERPRIDSDAISAAQRWDGIKGYVTNNFEMGPEQIIEHYGELYKVEQSFRMSKTDLRIRPTFHHVEERIRAHVIICMLALCVLRMLEQEVRPLGLTYRAALDEIDSARAAILKLGEQKFVIPPAYRPKMQQLLRALELRG